MKKVFLLILPLLIGLTSKGQETLNMIYNWQDSTLISSNTWGNVYNEIWGFVQDGKEYGVIGTTAGTHIFDLSDKSNIYEAAFISGKYQGEFVIHRDYHDYNGYLYIVCDEGSSSLQILDLSGLPNTPLVVYDSDAHFQRAHNIFIDKEAGIMYKCGGEHQLNLYSITDPENPTLIMNCAQDLSWWNSVGYLHDIYVENGIAYCNAGGKGLFVVDFSNLSNPSLLGSLTQYPDQGYNHSGYLSPNGSTYVLADETHGMDMKILDVSDPSDIKVTSQINSNVNSLSVAHNQVIAGNTLYVAYYYDGVYVYDITDPENAVLNATYPTSKVAHRNSFEGAWGVYPLLPSGLLLASDMQEGFFVFDNVVTNAETKTKIEETTIYPNPVDNFTLINNNESFETAKLFSLDGKLIKTWNLKNGKNALNFEKHNLSTGIFAVELSNNSFSKTIKLIKK